MNTRLHGATLILSAAAMTAFPAALRAAVDDYPNRPIRLIVPLAPGGPSDILARIVAQKLGANLRQTVIVDNRPGAGGSLGTDIAAKATPDGYTIVLASSSYSINATLYPKLPYDTLKDLTGVTMIERAPYIFAVHPSMPVKSMKELIALARARPGELNYASGGSGTGPQLAMEIFKAQEKLDIVHVPYKGGGPAMNAVMAGQVPMLFINMVAGLPQVKAGRLRALAVSQIKRSPAAPEIPTMDESGVPGFDEGGHHGILAPAATPHAIIARLNREIVKVLHEPDVESRLAAEGAEVVGDTPEEFNAIIRADVDKFGKVIRHLGLRVN